MANSKDFKTCQGEIENAFKKIFLKRNKNKRDFKA